MNEKSTIVSPVDEMPTMKKEVQKAVKHTQKSEVKTPKKSSKISASNMKPGLKYTSTYTIKCTKEERKNWAKFAYEVTGGEQNRLSNIARASFILWERLDRRRLTKRLENLEKPNSNDHIGIALYEEAISEAILEELRKNQ